MSITNYSGGAGEARHVEDTSFLLEALLVGGNDQVLELVLSPYYMRIARDAVLELDEIPAPPELDRTRALAVRLTLRSDVALKRICSSAALEPLLWRRLSCFALATRPEPPPLMDEPPELQTRRRAFLSSFGIDTSGDL